MKANMQQFIWLMNWYAVRCDGDWEHQWRVKINTLDNPGWVLRVNLADTEHAGREMPNKLVERTADDWLASEMKDNVFSASGGPLNLPELIDLFAAFVAGNVAQPQHG